MRMTDLIEKKKAGQELTEYEIEYIVQGYTKGDIPDYQMSAFLMAVCFQNMTDKETGYLTMAMTNSGDTLDLSALGEFTADKHSTGGVGDKTSLVLCPLMAACGMTMAKMSGRGLGFTGGTIDKLESFPGFSVEKTSQGFIQQAKEVGFVIAGQSGDLAPADKKMYALRDVTATVGCIPLICSSIMCKKLAAGAKTIVLDVKTGSGAFMDTEEKAILLAEKMVAVGKAANRNMAALVTDMDQPLGFAVGNALEVKEAISVLQGADVPDLKELCFTIGENILVRSGKVATTEQARVQMQQAIDSGSALERLAAMVKAQGGDNHAVYHPEELPTAPVIRIVPMPESGYIAGMMARNIGLVSMELGGGRATKEDTIDLSVGVVLKAKRGDYLETGAPLAEIHAASEEAALKAEASLLQCYSFSQDKPDVPKFIRKIIA